MGESAGQPNKGGRPTKFSRELVETICRLMAEGESLRAACEQHEIRHSTFLAWVFDESPDRDWVYDQYTRARSIQAEILDDEVLEIADDGRNDWMERHNKDGECIGWAVNGEHVARSRLRIEARERKMQRMAPKRYADLKRIEHSGNIETRKRIIVDRSGGA